jgi:hypothetical protein
VVHLEFSRDAGFVLDSILDIMYQHNRAKLCQQAIREGRTSGSL